MSSEEKESMDAREADVFEQELSLEDLNAAAGGDGEDSDDNCSSYHDRNMYGGAFPNCAASVEDGSSCDRSDACRHNSVVYYNEKYCFVSWS